MPHYPHQFLVGVAVLAATLLIRAVSVNRLIRSKLRLTLILSAAYALANLSFAWPSTFSASVGRLAPFDQLLVALGLINLLIVVAINPWREDRVPERFPNIVQDALVIGVFMVVGTLVLQEKVWTVSAVSGVAIGFALQDTLGNMFAGLAIQIEKPFRVGHWVALGAFEGKVHEITWRATKLLTKSGNVVAVPNNIVSKEAITNYSEPAAPAMISIEVGVSYDAAPSRVKEAMREAVADVEGVLVEPPPSVLLVQFADSSIVYRVRFWIDDWGSDEIIRDRVRSSIYYTLRRRRIEIPFPIQVQYRVPIPPSGPTPAESDALERLLAGADLFATLADDERGELAAASRQVTYGAGQIVVRQGAGGDSMFLILSGEVRVTVDPSGAEVARLGAGDYFGEMSLLTGDRRSATVAAASDCTLVEVTADAFRRLAVRHPDVPRSVSAVVESRRAGLERTRLSATEDEAGEAPRSLLARIQQFLGITTR